MKTVLATATQGVKDVKSGMEGLTMGALQSCSMQTAIRHMPLRPKDPIPAPTDRVQLPPRIQRAPSETRFPLSVVVADAVQRWFVEARDEALRGDVKMQALLGEMLKEGYGCTKNEAEGRYWTDKAARRGYRMKGVFCDL